MKAQIARGADFESGNLIKKAKSMVPLLVPLLFPPSGVPMTLPWRWKRGCYQGGDGRTKMKPLIYKKREIIPPMVLALYLTAAVVIGRILAKRVMLTVAYDGTNYHGWQLQSNGISIEEVLNRCLTQLLKEPVQVIGASRTDAGVHAWGNIAVFDTQARMPGEKFSLCIEPTPSGGYPHPGFQGGARGFPSQKNG